LGFGCAEVDFWDTATASCFIASLWLQRLLELVKFIV